MGSPLFKNDLLTGHEPWSEECSERPSPRPSPGGRGSVFPAGFEGLGRVLAGTGRDGSDGWSSGMSPCGICDTLSPRERVGVREPGSTLAIAATERFMESALFEIDLLTGLEPGFPGGGTPAATEARFMDRAVFQNLDMYGVIDYLMPARRSRQMRWRATVARTSRRQ